MFLPVVGNYRTGLPTHGSVLMKFCRGKIGSVSSPEPFFEILAEHARSMQLITLQPEVRF